VNRFTISIAVVVVVVGLLFYQAFQKGTSLYVLPSQLAEKSSADPNAKMSRIRVIGKVSSDPVNYEVEPEIKLEFTIHDPDNSAGLVPVVYKGIKPDMFAVGRDVIIDGEFANGHLVASKLLTQCPSKYEPPDPSVIRDHGPDMSAHNGSSSDSPHG